VVFDCKLFNEGNWTINIFCVAFIELISHQQHPTCLQSSALNHELGLFHSTYHTFGLLEQLILSFTKIVCVSTLLDALRSSTFVCFCNHRQSINQYVNIMIIFYFFDHNYYNEINKYTIPVQYSPRQKPFTIIVGPNMSSTMQPTVSSNSFACPLPLSCLYIIVGRSQIHTTAEI